MRLASSARLWFLASLLVPAAFVACTSFGSGAPEPDGGEGAKEAGPPEVDARAPEADARAPEAAAPDVDASVTCTDQWSTNFDTASSLDVVWARGSQGTELDTHLRLFDGGGGVLVSEYVGSGPPRRSDYSVYSRLLRLRGSFTRVGFDVGEIPVGARGSDFTIAQLLNVVPSDAGLRALSFRFRAGTLVITTSDDQGGIKPVAEIQNIDGASLTRIELELEPNGPVRIRVGTGTFAELPKLTAALTDDAALQVGAFFNVTDPPEKFGVTYDNVRVETCTR